MCVFQVCFRVCVCVKVVNKYVCLCLCVFQVGSQVCVSVKDRCPADSISYNYVESIMGLGVQRNMLKSRNEYLGIRLKENKNIFILFMLSLIFTLFSYIIIRYKNYVLS